MADQDRPSSSSSDSSMNCSSEMSWEEYFQTKPIKKILAKFGKLQQAPNEHTQTSGCENESNEEPNLQAYSSNSSSIDQTDDSNDEGNWRNDYPDEGNPFLPNMCSTASSAELDYTSSASEEMSSSS